MKNIQITREKINGEAKAKAKLSRNEHNTSMIFVLLER
jgi:hypothetical protein